MSVEQILAGVADGTIPSRMEGHFLFVGMGGGERPTQPAITAENVVDAQAILSDGEQTALEDIHREELNSGETNLSQWKLARFQSSLKRRPLLAA